MAETVDNGGFVEPVGNSRFEIAIAWLLGIAAVLIAFSATRAALLGDVVLEGFTTSTQHYNDANDLDNADTQQFVQDQNLFLRYAEALVKNDDELAEYMRANLFEPELEAAVAWWQTTGTGDGEGPESAFDEGSPYALPNTAASKEALRLGDEAFETAKKADDQGDNFDIASAILAITLFAGGIASLMHSRVIRQSLTVLAIGSLVAGCWFVANGQWP